MKKAFVLIFLIFSLACVTNAQQRNSFSLGLGTISTQNNSAQPATSLNGQFEALLIDSKEEMRLYLAVDLSTYLKEDPRFSSCSDCQNNKYSGFDIGVRLSFELQETFVPINVFTGFSRIITKEKITRNFGRTDTIYLGPELVGSRSFLNNFWDLGIGIKAPFSNRFFLSAEALTGYSLESDSNQQGFERFEFNMGIGVSF